MTIRERIADWLTGGEYSDALVVARGATREMIHKHNQSAERGAALRQIAALETPKANATVRKMARIAREASHG